MEFKGTKGKWYVSNQPDGLSVHSKRQSSGIDIVCKIENQFHSEDTKYNAKLISKAAEMLEALKYLVEVLKAVNIPTKPIIERVENLIKEATEI